MSAGRLIFVSSTEIKLIPYNGNRLLINGVDVTIPAAGVSLAPTGLTEGTVYYIYAYLNAGVLALEPSTTIRATDAATGVAIKFGDPTRTLVGLARPTTGVLWLDDAGSMDVRSWFNRLPRAIYREYTADRVNSGTTFIEIHPEMRTHFLTWRDEGYLHSYVASVHSSAAAVGATRSQMWYDGTAFSPYPAHSNFTAGYIFPHAQVGCLEDKEGWTMFALYGQNFNAAPSTWQGPQSRLFARVVG